MPFFSAYAAIAVTTYQVGKLFLIGRGSDGQLSIVVRALQRCMGIAASFDVGSLILASELQIVRLDNVLPARQMRGKHDAVYAPHQTWITGELDIQNVAVRKYRRIVFGKTLTLTRCRVDHQNREGQHPKLEI